MDVEITTTLPIGEEGVIPCPNHQKNNPQHQTQTPIDSKADDLLGIVTITVNCYDAQYFDGGKDHELL